jgi:protease I
MADELQGKRIAILATTGVEQVELEQPRDAVKSAGAQAEVLSIEQGEIQAMNHDIDKGDKIAATGSSRRRQRTSTTA